MTNTVTTPESYDAVVAAWVQDTATEEVERENRTYRRAEWTRSAIALKNDAGEKFIGLEFAKATGVSNSYVTQMKRMILFIDHGFGPDTAKGSKVLGKNGATVFSLAAQKAGSKEFGALVATKKLTVKSVTDFLTPAKKEDKKREPQVNTDKKTPVEPEDDADTDTMGTANNTPSPMASFTSGAAQLVKMLKADAKHPSANLSVSVSERERIASYVAELGKLVHADNAPISIEKTA